MLFIHSEIYPYVVITIGLENILIIVKAVMSTPVELDVSHAILLCDLVRTRMMSNMITITWKICCCSGQILNRKLQGMIKGTLWSRWM